MKFFGPIILFALLLTMNHCSPKKDDVLLFIKGGPFRNTQSNLYGKSVTVSDFYIGKYEVAQKEWVALMGNNPSKFKGENLPVESVSWYDCIEYCNKRSLKEGLVPYYNIYKDILDTINTSEFDSLKWVITNNVQASGYRLPTEVEWEYVAGGAQLSKNFRYSGGNDIDKVAWYWRNSGDSILRASWSWVSLENNNCKTKPVGRKQPNELGVYDMSGNVREWCEDWYEDVEIHRGLYRSQRGGGWMGADYRCESSDRHSFAANGKGPDQGFRVCRNNQ